MTELVVFIIIGVAILALGIIGGVWVKRKEREEEARRHASVARELLG